MERWFNKTKGCALNKYETVFQAVTKEKIK